MATILHYLFETAFLVAAAVIAVSAATRLSWDALDVPGGLLGARARGERLAAAAAALRRQRELLAEKERLIESLAGDDPAREPAQDVSAVRARITEIHAEMERAAAEAAASEAETEDRTAREREALDRARRRARRAEVVLLAVAVAGAVGVAAGSFSGAA
ncbi:hypothetical protein [Marinitenerispora sediminis]|uniref:Uncharacterized protein n=1 Tax=Marinitenerispora sediminis TaxID=1931232 RepID=A0A368TB59_9ACTN|nr:hypothetical protein [Marinitenerispora sediminis]RCV51360.1 hypothetical protein DEF28_15665 [Marinitenerispora sediminis]RCV57188.1 hypothetical protein DEF23_11240 [Marinitenerispora sediminis]RCV60305.1 hypothetical protein DEF24_07460 [Marinitenerispora sediminis]